MKILQLNIEGFRSLKKVEWKPGDLNVVIGPNASGKSNLLEALDLFPHIVDGSLSEHLQRSGGIDWLAWNREAENITLGSVFTAPELKSDINYDPGIRFDLSLHRLGKRNQYRVERELLEELLFVPGAQEPFSPHTDAVYIDRDASRAIVSRRPIAAELLDNEESILAANRKIQLSLGVDAFSAYAGQWQIFKSFRTDSAAEIRGSQVARVRRRLRDEIDLANVLHTLYTNDSDFEEEIDLGMSAAFPDYDKLVFPPSSEQQIELAVKWKSLRDPQPAVTLSDGTLRFLFVITALVSAESGGLIAIDEPETGLHPLMFGIIASYAAEAARKTQVVFTTHSTEFLNAMSKFQPTTTIVSLENGETTLETVDKETLEYWLKKHYLGDMFASGQLEAIA